MNKTINPFKRIKQLEARIAKLESLTKETSEATSKCAKRIDNIKRNAVVNTMEYGKVDFPQFITAVTRRVTFIQKEVNQFREELNRLTYGDD